MNPEIWGGWLKYFIKTASLASCCRGDEKILFFQDDDGPLWNKKKQDDKMDTPGRGMYRDRLFVNKEKVASEKSWFQWGPTSKYRVLPSELI